MPFDPDAFLASKGAAVAPAAPEKSASFDPDAFLKDDAQSRAKDSTFDPAAWYNESPSNARMQQAVEVAKYRAKQPSDPLNTAEQFGMGVVKGLPSAVTGLAKGVGGLASDAWTAATGSGPEQERAKREAAASVQLGALQGFQGLKDAAHTLRTWDGHEKPDRDLSEDEWKERIQNQAAMQSVENEIRNGNLQGDFYNKLSAVRQTPEQLAQSGAPVRPERVENMSFVGDPRTYLMDPLAEAAGPVVSKALGGAGKVAEVAGKVASAARAGHATPAGLLISALRHSPLDASIVFSADLASRGLPGLGKMMGEAGAEAGGAAAPVGQSLLRKATKAGMQGAVTGGLLSAPYMLAADSPQSAGEALGGGLGLGGVMGALGGVKNARATEVGAKSAELSRQGAAKQYGMGEDAMHSKWMATLPKPVQDAINTYRGAFNGFANKDGVPVQIYVAGGDDYTRLQGGKPVSDTRGFISDDGTQIVLNADYAKTPGEANATLGHEAAGHLVEKLGEISKAQDVSTLQDFLDKSTKNNPRFKNFVRNQVRSLFNPNLSDVEADAVAKRITYQPGKERYFEKELLAQHAKQILSGTNIADFTLPKSIKDNLVTGARNWLRNKGILSKTGGDIGWGAPEIKEVTDQLRNILYRTGAEGEELRKTPPKASVAARMRQLESTLKTPPTAQSPVEDVKAYQSAQKEYADLQKFGDPSATFPAAGTPPVPPSKPSVPPPSGTVPTPTAPVVAPARPIAGVVNGLKGLGYSQRDATQMANDAQGNTVEEMLRDALAKKQGKPISSTKPEPTKDVTQPATVSSVPDKSGEPVGSKPVGTIPQESNTKAVPVSKEEIDSIYKEAVKGVPPKQQSRKGIDAVARAHSKALGGKTDLVSWVQNPLYADDPSKGEIRGKTLDLNDPFHQMLLEKSGLSPDKIKMLQDIQAQAGHPIGSEYLSASEEPGAKAAFKADLEDQQNAVQRRRAQEEASASGRIQGKYPVRRVAKSFIPNDIVFNLPSERITLEGISPDKMLSNAAKLLPYLATKGVKSYDGVNDPNLLDDFTGANRNQQNGWNSQGSRPVEGTALTSMKAPTPGYEPYVIPDKRFQVLNALMADSTAGLLNEEGVPKARGDALLRKSKQDLARLNARFHDAVTGETNWIRSVMMKDGDFKFTTSKGDVLTGPKVLESVYETLNPELVENIRDPNIKNEHTIRPSNFTGDLSKMQGTPNPLFTAGGFQPTDSFQNKTHLKKVNISEIAHDGLENINAPALRDGEKDPIILERTTRGKLVLVDGYHRLSGLKKAGETQITSIILSPEDADALKDNDEDEIKRVQEKIKNEATLFTAGGFQPAEEAGVDNKSEATKNRAKELWKTMGVKSPFFKKWFSGSKVVDSNNNPLVVYKGMNTHSWQDGSEINVIDRKTEFPTFDSFDKKGVKLAGFFTDKPEVADKFTKGLAAQDGSGSATFPVYLNINNPHVIDAKGKPSGMIQFGKEGKPFRDAVNSGKYDGVIIKNTSDEGSVFIPLKPEQIKSSIGNTGEFSSINPDIRYMPKSNESYVNKPSESASLATAPQSQKRRYSALSL